MQPPGPFERTLRPYRSCERKIAYSSRSAARDAASRMARDTAEKYVVYQCNLCKFWHVGHRKRQG